VGATRAEAIKNWFNADFGKITPFEAKKLAWDLERTK